MRIWLLALAAGLAACAARIPLPADDGLRPLPFPVARGSALPPPTQAGRQAAPPEGVGPGGVDFGQWRSADPAVYTPAFQTQMRTRLSSLTRAEVAADLAANGFACEDGERLDCRIEIMERECAFDWYVVLEAGRAEPIAGFELMCLGAR